MKVFVFLSLISISWQIDVQIKKSENPVEVPITEFPEHQPVQIKQKCLNESKLDRYTFEELSNDNGTVFPGKNPEFFDYLSCYWKTKGLQEENGAINFNELRKLINYAVQIAGDASDIPLTNTWIIATKIVGECKNVQGKTHGEKAVKMRNCLFGKLLKQRSAQTDWDEFEDIPNLDSTQEDCVNELKLNGPLIEDINRHYLVPENISEFNDFLGCSWKKVNIMDKEGNFNISALNLKLDEVVENEILARSRVVYLSDVITESIIEGCRKIKGSSDGEFVMKVQNCILRRLPYFKIVIV